MDEFLYVWTVCITLTSLMWPIIGEKRRLENRMMMATMRYELFSTPFRPAQAAAILSNAAITTKIKVRRVNL